MPGPLAAAAVLGQAVGAIQNVVNEIKRLPDAVRGFVDAFNPQAGVRLDYAFRSLSATIGFALEPVISVTTRIVEQFADAISSGMDRLRAPMEKVTALFAGALQPALAAVGTVFDGLADAAGLLEPFFAPLAELFEGLMGIAHILTAVGVELALAQIKEWIDQAKTLGGIIPTVSEGFIKLAEATLRLADFMLSVSGYGDLMEGILRRLAEPQREAGRRAPAPQNFGIGGLEELYRRRLVEAAKGGGKDVAEQSRDYLADLRRLAEEMLDELRNRPGDRAAGQRRAAEGAHDVAMGGPVFREVLGERAADAVDTVLGGPIWRALIALLTPGGDRQGERNGR